MRAKSKLGIRTKLGFATGALEEAMVIALRRNLGLKVERYRRAASFETIRQAKGIFDLNLSLNVLAVDQAQASATVLDGAHCLNSYSGGVGVGRGILQRAATLQPASNVQMIVLSA